MIELLIVMVVVAVLASVAYPSYEASIRKSRRSEAFAALATVQQQQERWRSAHADYAAAIVNTASAGDPANGLGLPGTTATGYYTLDIASISGSAATSYRATATAVTGTSQANDGNCKVLGVEVNSVLIRYGSGAANIGWDADSPDSGRCWVR